MKSFKHYITEYREFQRTDKRRSVAALHSSGAYEPNSRGYINFTTYHGGNFGETRGQAPSRKGFARTPAERMSIMDKRAAAGIRATEGQPVHSFLGLSTTPDATAAREYRTIDRARTAPYVANPNETLHFNDRLYELHGRVHKDNVKMFDNYEQFHEWHSGIKKEIDSGLQSDREYLRLQQERKNLGKSLGPSLAWNDHPEIEAIEDKMEAHRFSMVHDHITNKLGIRVAIIGTNKQPDILTPPGSGRAKHSGEIMLFKPRDTIHTIRDRSNEVDIERQRIKPAIERLGRIRNQ
jgi:hypothetical protein